MSKLEEIMKFMNHDKLSGNLLKDMSSIEDFTQEVPKRKMQGIKPLPREVDTKQGIQSRVLDIRDRCIKKG